MARLLDVKELETRFFTENGVVKAVNHVTFHVDEGETLGVVGESGSGKSVTMLSLMKLIPQPPGKVTGGEALFQGRDLVQMNQNEMREIRGNNMAMIFQDPMTSLNPVLRISTQIMEALELHLKLNKQEARDRAVELLRMVGIPAAEKRIDDYPHQFSGGMRQRVMIAIGLACVPQLLIADEPTTALDVTIQAQIVDLVKDLRSEIGMAIIWITHDMSLLASLADRIMVMYAGEIVEVAPVNQLYENPRHPYTIGLLRSIPRLDSREHERLQPVQGFPPDLIDYPTTCPFMPRCPYAISQCVQDPDLEEVGDRHFVRCWVKPRGEKVLAHHHRVREIT
ncbi:MAG: ABC transporter ATP-binding protein [Anaerolineales bacterium]|nr:ABC transporter ATP-binding protein [Anaerolineales bacterium]MCB9128588.1 ABC transporter ATP-binding protein [Ardenticatenales bacterium]MCB9172526.1 ABC transporter ATP-binding protein [Ardenticatenales bacterium]